MHVVILDSASTDGTEYSVLPADWQYLRIEKADFNHGDTRTQALRYVPLGTDIVVFMTQDAILATPGSLKTLVSAFTDGSVACAYGRQLPHADATPLAEHARYFNYPAASRTLSMVDQPRLGLKTCFLSNSFAAYRLADLLDVGGFPNNVILGEDMSVAGRLLMGVSAWPMWPKLASNTRTITRYRKSFADTLTRASFTPAALGCSKPSVRQEERGCALYVRN